MNARAIEKTELNKILETASIYAVLDGGKKRVISTHPTPVPAEAKRRLNRTEECLALLFSHGISKVEYFPPFSDEIDRAKKQSTLSCAELLKVGNLLRSARIAYTSIHAINDETITDMKTLAEKIYFDFSLEEDIQTKILSDTEVSDHASDKLYSLRREIRLLNERIRNRLSEYLTGSEGKYLQDGIVTMRDNRYVLPVRAEYKRNIKGFIHDRSASGATFFIEPEEVLEMNNELRTLTIDEKEEVERILNELSKRVGMLGDNLLADVSLLEEIDCAYALAEYAYKLSCVKPEINGEGKIAIEMGRHPLIDQAKVVPVSLSLGEHYRFLLISGPNTGGKTVTLKMVGLFCMMAACGLFVPAKRAVLSTFDEIYCDVGDAQSIEENLSTFSSHITNIIHIVKNANEKSLVLIDELGGGTDPEEGQALAKAIVADLLDKGCAGVVTTHYTALKEFAFATDGIENACMEFDSDTLQPLYVIKIGLPGSSNALGISRRLGLDESILQNALSYLSTDAQKFEHIVRSAEESRVQAEQALAETNRLKTEWQEKLRVLETERTKLQKEKDKLYSQAKAEARRVVNERAASAEELLAEMEEIFAQATVSESDLIKARTLKNRLINQAYTSDTEDAPQPQYRQASETDLKIGATVFVKNINQSGVIQSVRLPKKEAEILCGNIRVRSKFSELFLLNGDKKAQTTDKKKIDVKKTLAPKPAPSLEINVIGKTVAEAAFDVENFLDAAVVSNLEEVRIVHGVGTGKLRAGIHDFLKKYPRVAEFRLGKYGEGETGVTIVKIK